MGDYNISGARSPEYVLSRLDDKIRGTQERIAQLQLQVFNEQKKLDKFLTERHAMHTALQTNSYITRNLNEGEQVKEEGVESGGGAQEQSEANTQSSPSDQEAQDQYDDQEVASTPNAAMRPPLLTLDSTTSTSSYMISESPASPPPTAVLSPPPLKNRLYAGHTPMNKLALSPIPSEMQTPLAAPPRAPVVPLREYSARARNSLLAADMNTDNLHLPEPSQHSQQPDAGYSDDFYDAEPIPQHFAEDDPSLTGPLTAVDEGFLPALTKKLQKVKSEDDLPHVLARVRYPSGDRRRSDRHRRGRKERRDGSGEYQKPEVPKWTFGSPDSNPHASTDMDPVPPELTTSASASSSEHLDTLPELDLHMPPRVKHAERLEGVTLKEKRSMNFGTPLGMLH